LIGRKILLGLSEAEPYCEEVGEREWEEEKKGTTKILIKKLDINRHAIRPASSKRILQSTGDAEECSRKKKNRRETGIRKKDRTVSRGREQIATDRGKKEGLH